MHSTYKALFRRPVNQGAGALGWWNPSQCALALDVKVILTPPCMFYY
jgi:hypothetical protein